MLFGAGQPRSLSGALLRIESDVNGGLYDPIQTDQRVRYTIETRSNARDPGRLSEDRAAPPRHLGTRYLTLPELSPEVRSMAELVTSDATTDAERALAIESHLRANGRYTDTPPPLEKAGSTPVEAFLLGELEGHCEYFASGMVVLARQVGLPARLVNGFAGGRENPLGGFVELSRSDAHAWVEIHFEEAGWVRYDPTPPDLRLAGLAEMGFFEHLSALGSTIELWWFQRIVDFDSSDQIAALKSAFSAWRRIRKAADDDGSDGKTRSFADMRFEDLDLGKALLALALAGALSAMLVRRARGRRGDPRVPTSYRTALALLARRGLTRSPSELARGFASRAGAELPAPAAAAFLDLTESYLAARFGAAERPRAADQLDHLRRALADTRGA